MVYYFNTIRTAKYEKLEKSLSHCTRHCAITSAYLNWDLVYTLKRFYLIALAFFIFIVSLGIKHKFKPHIAIF